MPAPRPPRSIVKDLNGKRVWLKAKRRNASQQNALPVVWVYLNRNRRKPVAILAYGRVFRRQGLVRERMSVWARLQSPPTEAEKEAFRLYRESIPHHDKYAFDHFLAGYRARPNHDPRSADKR